jgi:hypothetical protein
MPIRVDVTLMCHEARSAAEHGAAAGRRALELSRFLHPSVGGGIVKVPPNPNVGSEPWRGLGVESRLRIYSIPGAQSG